MFIAKVLPKTPFELTKEFLLTKVAKQDDKPYWPSLFSEFDTSGDGNLDFQEFLDGCRLKGLTQDVVNDEAFYKMFAHPQSDAHARFILVEFMLWMEKTPFQHSSHILLSAVESKANGASMEEIFRKLCDSSGYVSFFSGHSLSIFLGTFRLRISKIIFENSRRFLRHALMTIN